MLRGNRLRGRGVELLRRAPPLKSILVRLLLAVVVAQRSGIEVRQEVDLRRANRRGRSYGAGRRQVSRVTGRQSVVVGRRVGGRLRGRRLRGRGEHGSGTIAPRDHRASSGAAHVLLHRGYRLDVVLCGRVGGRFHRFHGQVQRGFPLPHPVRLGRRGCHGRGDRGLDRGARILIRGRVLLVPVILAPPHGLMVITGSRAIPFGRLVTVYRRCRWNGRSRCRVAYRGDGGARRVAALVAGRHRGRVTRVTTVLLLGGVVSAVRGIGHRVRPPVHGHRVIHGREGGRILGQPLRRRRHRGRGRRDDRNFVRCRCRSVAALLPLHRRRLPFARGFPPVGMIGRQGGDGRKVVRVAAPLTGDRRLGRAVGRGVGHLDRAPLRPVRPVVRYDRFARLIRDGAVRVPVPRADRLRLYRHLLDVRRLLARLGSARLRVIVGLRVLRRRLRALLVGMIRRLWRQSVRIRGVAGRVRLLIVLRGDGGQGRVGVWGGVRGGRGRRGRISRRVRLEAAVRGWRVMRRGVRIVQGGHVGRLSVGRRGGVMRNVVGRGDGVITA